MSENVAFTGHRRIFKDFDYNLLDRVILNLIKNGAKNFYCGMAIGFDILVAESVLRFKNDYGINLYACIPCENQSEEYSESYKRRYEQIMRKCDGEIFLSETYYKGCMQARDRFMVDNADTLVCYLRKKTGGTFYTVNYAAKKNIKIIEL